MAEIHGCRGLILGLLAAAFLIQLSTGNVIVRLVLAATGTTNPRYGSEPDPDPELRLKGGRLLGPMERVFIVGLGLSGHLTAARKLSINEMATYAPADCPLDCP